MLRALACHETGHSVGLTHGTAGNPPVGDQSGLKGILSAMIVDATVSGKRRGNPETHVETRSSPRLAILEVSQALKGTRVPETIAVFDATVEERLDSGTGQWQDRAIVAVNPSRLLKSGMHVVVALVPDALAKSPGLGDWPVLGLVASDAVLVISGDAVADLATDNPVIRLLQRLSHDELIATLRQAVG